MTGPEPLLRRWSIIVVLIAFATPPVTLVLFWGIGVSVTGEIAASTTVIPLAVGTVVLGFVAREVASTPDEPELVDRRVGKALEKTSEEYEALWNNYDE